MMKVIDKREKETYTYFSDLAIGEAFVDEGGDVHIKTDIGATMYWDAVEKIWRPYHSYSADEPITPINISYVIGAMG